MDFHKSTAKQENIITRCLQHPLESTGNGRREREREKKGFLDVKLESVEKKDEQTKKLWGTRTPKSCSWDVRDSLSN